MWNLEIIKFIDSYMPKLATISWELVDGTRTNSYRGVKLDRVVKISGLDGVPIAADTILKNNRKIEEDIAPMWKRKRGNPLAIARKEMRTK